MWWWGCRGYNGGKGGDIDDGSCGGNGDGCDSDCYGSGDNNESGANYICDCGASGVSCGSGDSGNNDDGGDSGSDDISLVVVVVAVSW